MISGMRKAADLPDPVGANAIISLALSPIGIAYIWIGIGVWNSKSSKFYLRSLGQSLISSHDLIGGGQTPPLTWIELSSRNIRQSLSPRASLGLKSYVFLYMKFLMTVPVAYCSTPPIDPLPNSNTGCFVTIASLAVSSLSSHWSLNSCLVRSRCFVYFG